MDASTLDISRAVLPEGQYDGEDEDAKSLLEYLSGISDCSSGTDDEAASQAEPLPPLSVMADATPAEYRRLLHAVSAMRTELQACRSANAALHADRHAVWASLQASQQREQALQHALAAERQHKGFLLHYVQGEGHGQDGLDLSLEALRGSAAEAAAELAERRSQEALQAQAKAAAACSALARAEAVHEAERQALQSEIARLNEGLATGAIVQADSRRSGQAQAAAHERLVHGMRADLATVRRQRAEAEEELERLVGDMSSMRARLEEKDVAIDGLASDLRVSGEALSIVKHALAQRNAELQAARRRVDELQRTVDRTTGGDIASFVTTSSNAVALLKER